MNKFWIVDEYGYKDYKYLNKVIKRALRLEHVKKALFSIIFIDDEKMHEMNKKYRGIDRSTDVLSFAFEDNEKVRYNVRNLGEIYISIPKMKEQAKEYGHSEKRELAFLTVHGILHLLGFDHTKGEKEEKEMFARQELVLDAFRETKRVQEKRY